MTAVGVVAASAGGVEKLREGLVQPLLDDGHQVAIILTPTAAAWLDHIGERQRLAESPAYPCDPTHGCQVSRAHTPRSTCTSAHR